LKLDPRDQNVTVKLKPYQQKAIDEMKYKKLVDHDYDFGGIYTPYLEIPMMHKPLPAVKLPKEITKFLGFDKGSRTNEFRQRLFRAANTLMKLVPSQNFDSDGQIYVTMKEIQDNDFQDRDYFYSAAKRGHVLIINKFYTDETDGDIFLKCIRCGEEVSFRKFLENNEMRECRR
jgi:hypothetical protein